MTPPKSCNDWPCASTLDEMSKKLDDIHKIVTGNGTPENGMVVKLDRVRMVVKVILWASGILGSSTLAGALWFIWKTIQHVGVVQ